MYLEIFLADFTVFRVFGGNFAGFRGNTWISRVRDRVKYQKPCLTSETIPAPTPKVPRNLWGRDSVFKSHTWRGVAMSLRAADDEQNNILLRPSWGKYLPSLNSKTCHSDFVHVLCPWRIKILKNAEWLTACILWDATINQSKKCFLKNVLFVWF